MPETVNLTQATVEQVQDFLDSFDVVLSDCDGVIWYTETAIPGAIEAISRLQDLGKRLYLVTNNSTISIDRYCKRLQINGFNIKPEQIINPAKVINWYLKKIQFSGEVFTIASKVFQQTLIDDGVRVTMEMINLTEERPRALLDYIEKLSSVKAVIVDFSLFFDWAKVVVAIDCLKKKDVLYIIGAHDNWLVHDFNRSVLGCGAFIEILTKYSGRTPIYCAKPSQTMKDYILETCNLKDPKRCLFIGDTVNHDMEFGAMCGFKKMFVSTGLDDLKDAEKSEETRPDFYIPSLALLTPIIDSLHKNSVNQKTSQ